jgi:serine/threonine-protein kinase
MAVCPGCSSEILASSRFCANCGAAVEAIEAGDPRLGATRELTASESGEPNPTAGSGTGSVLDSITGEAEAPEPGDLSGSMADSSIQHGRFLPGTVLDERYRIVGLLGQGGMGEVYRADDLKLGQSVALKFLPEALANDPTRLELLHNEVRLARQVSHPNVCRVYDIGEIDGQHFLSMEFIDGEDLSGLMRRIGRLPSDKGVDIARQLCGGLYAAHEKGVLHRDLKPANIMLDGRGQVRITDFGLARLTDAETASGNRVGTPAYMAPEQLAGEAVTIQSDIYSLGLVLHEVFTGQPVYHANSIAELVRLRDESSPSTLSSVVPDIDPAVERVILRCLEKEPTRRPGSVVQIAAALPGGDPLAAALAAGETPSPELVAASGDNTGFTPRTGGILLGVFMLLVVAVVLLSDRVSFVVRSRLESKPDVLEAKARDIASELVGKNADLPVRDSTYGYWFNPDQLMRQHDELQESGDGKLEFWYRQSPAYLNPQHPFLYTRQPRKVTLSDPHPNETGMVGVRLSARGWLREISLVTPLTESSPDDTSSKTEPTWQRPFELAGLQLDDYKPASPQWTPPGYSEQRFAWVLAEPPGNKRESRPNRVEAATYHGRVSYFQVLHDWTTRQWTVPSRKQNSLGTAAQVEESIQFSSAIFFLIGGPLLVISSFLALRNLRQGSADKKGALRFAVVLALVDWGTALLEAHHTLSPSLEMTTLISCLVNSVGRTIRFWIYYVALEPHVRRIWPRVLISWSRFVDGRLTDPLVGREILVGCLFGVFLAILFELRLELDGFRHGGIIGNRLWSPEALLGGKGIAETFGNIVFGAMTNIFALLTLLIFRIITRKDWLAIVLFTAMFTKINTSGSDGVITYVFVALVQLTTVAAALRFGLLTMMSAALVQTALTRFPVTGNLAEWYAASGLVGLGIAVGLALIAFYVSLGDQSLLGNRLADSKKTTLSG